MKLVAVVLLAIAAVLGYGYWFGASHGALSVSVDDVSDRNHPHPVVPVELSFFDAKGTELAQASSSGPSGVIYVTSPAMYACHGVEERAPFSASAREEWDRCFEGQSRWVPTWIRRVAYVDLRSGRCAVRRLAPSISEYADDWWLWWVPLPHNGGKPYTSFSVVIAFDQSQCTPAA